LFSTSGLVIAVDLATLTDVVSPKNTHIVTVKNNSNVLLTGMIIKNTDYPPNPAQGSQGWFYYDSILSQGQRALAPGETFTIEYGPYTFSPQPEFSLESAVFSDGSAVGSTGAVKALWNRRLWRIKAYEMAFRDFDVNVSVVKDRVELLAVLEKAKRANYGPDTPREQRNAIMAAYDTLIGNIRDNPTIDPSHLLNQIKSDHLKTQQKILSQKVPAQVLTP